MAPSIVNVRRSNAQAAFLVAFATRGVLTHAALEAGVGRRTVYDWLAGDCQFKAAFDEALRDAIDVLEAEAYRRAVEGWDEPVYQKGRQVGVVRKYSDRMLELLLKGKKPEVYGTRRVESKVDAKVAAVQEFDASKLTDEQLAEAQVHLDALDALWNAADGRQGS